MTTGTATSTATGTATSTATGTATGRSRSTATGTPAPEGGWDLDEAHYRLLTRRSVREAFLSGQPCDFSEEAQALLREVDPEELRATAERMVDDLLSLKYRGTGGLRAVFERSLGAYRTAHPEDDDCRDLIGIFLESEEYRAYRELPYAGPGCCIEEAFCRFAQRNLLADPEVRADAEVLADPEVLADEFLAGVLKALLLNPEPSFRVPDVVQEREGCFFALRPTSKGQVMLHAAARGRYIGGAVTPFVAAVLSAGTEAERRAAASQFGVSDAVREATVQRLRGLGLLAERAS